MLAMSNPLEKIISGAQTGVDRGALDAALARGFPCGGWVPAGRLAEDGVIPAHYPVKELEKGGYRQRTIQNLLDADGTLILYFGELEGGTQETAFRCMKLRRPFRLVDAVEIPPKRCAELAAEFVRAKGLRSLNVAGPRAGKEPKAHAYAREAVDGLLSILASETRRSSR